MKRSEMLEIIMKRVKDEDLADIILMDIELFGMLPPERKLGYRDSEALRSWSLTDQIKGYHSWDKEE